MKILGLNGLGVAPSACLLDNGRLVAMAEEERFNRYKGSFGFMPGKATRYCLEYGDADLNDIDYIAFGWDSKLYEYFMPIYSVYTYLRYAPKFQTSSNILRNLDQLIKYHSSSVKSSIKTMILDAGISGRTPPIIFVPHHLCHAAESFYCSGFESAHIMVIDGSGENNATSIYHGNKHGLHLVKQHKIPNSLGWFYQGITDFLGFKPNLQEGKTMALAAYGCHDKKVASAINRMLRINKNGTYKYDAVFSMLGNRSEGKVFSDSTTELLGQPRTHGKSFTQHHKNIAFHAQQSLETAACSMVKSLSRKRNYNGKMCISGGVGLNCRMNGAVADLPCVDDLFVSPFPNDAGSALGAALMVAQRKNELQPHKLTHSYWGPSFENNDIEEILKKSRVNYTKLENVESEAASLLTDGKIIGWFQGRMETGARALGNRSILAKPTGSWISNHVNMSIKNREPWRPFAPSILYEDRHDYISGNIDAPFMSIAFSLKEGVRSLLPAVVHIDGSTRPHSVRKDVNERYWNLLNEMKKQNGHGVVLNTSFNGAGEPIVCTPYDALRTFYSSGLDYLFVEDFMVMK